MQAPQDARQNDAEAVVVRIEGSDLDGAWRHCLKAAGLQEVIGQQKRRWSNMLEKLGWRRPGQIIVG